MSRSTYDTAGVVRSFLACLSRLDVPAITELVTEDMLWKVPGDLAISGTYKGKAAFVNEFLGGADALFVRGSLNFDIRNLFVAGDVVVAEYTGTAESATTGKQYRNDYCVIFEMREGKVASGREYMDTSHVADVLLATGSA